jgi:uncharacterized membrane protein HdeD (DUF308 family)
MENMPNNRDFLLRLGYLAVGVFAVFGGVLILIAALTAPAPTFLLIGIGTIAAGATNIGRAFPEPQTTSSPD